MTKIIVIIGFMVSFAAGLVVGISAHRPPLMPTMPPGPRPDRGPGGWLTRELKLNPDQQEQMRQIWSEVAHRGGREQDERRAQLRRERDEAIAALIHPEDLGAYDQVLKHYSDQLAVLDKEWRDAFDAAVKKTESILTAEQLAKYQELRKQRQPPWEGGRRGGPGGPGGPPTGPGGFRPDRHDRAFEDRADHPTSRPTSNRM
jgi:Spy/CpxP family protein refolding chaperone